MLRRRKIKVIKFKRYEFVEFELIINMNFILVFFIFGSYRDFFLKNKVIEIL